MLQSQPGHRTVHLRNGGRREIGDVHGELRTTVRQNSKGFNAVQTGENAHALRARIALTAATSVESK